MQPRDFFVDHSLKGIKGIPPSSATIANSYRTTGPAAIINQFNLKEGDKLNWTLKADEKELIIVVKAVK